MPVDGGPYALAAGPDGAMWVTLVHRGAIARVTPTARCDEYPGRRRTRKPSIITAGPDGALWFTRSGDDRIGRITTDGERQRLELPSGSAPFGITVGPDGALWFTAMTSGLIGRIGVDGEVTEEAVVGGMPSMITDRSRRRAVVHAQPGQRDRQARTGAAALTLRRTADPRRRPRRHRRDPRRHGVVHRDPAPTRSAASR